VLVSVQASRLQDPGAGGNRRTIVYWGLPSAAASFGGHHLEMERWLDRHAVDRIVFSHVTSDGLQMADLLRIFGDTAVPVMCAPDWAQAPMHVTVDQVGQQPCIDLWGSLKLLSDRQLQRSFDLLVSGAGLLLTPLCFC